MINIENSSECSIPTSNIDLCILACGIETRSVLASLFFSKIESEHYVVCNFDETKESRAQVKNNLEIMKNFRDCTSRVENLYLEKEHGRKFREKIVNILQTKLCSSIPVTVIIDYSSMPRNWYYDLFQYFCDKKLTNISIYCIYRASKAVEKSMYTDVSNVKTSDFQYGLTEPDKPKMVLLGIGYDSNGADALIQKLECEPYLFYTDPGLLNGVVDKILDNNKMLFASHPSFTIDIKDISSCIKKLDEIYLAKKDEYSIMIAPLGPKPMILIALYFTLIHPDIHRIAVSNSYSNIETYIDTPQAVGCVYKISF